jgi:HEAT repeat protein
MAMNLQKVVHDLHGADEQTKTVAVTLLLKLPAAQLLADQEIFRQLHHLSREGGRRSTGNLGDLFNQLWERMENLRVKNEAIIQGTGKGIDLSGLGRGSPAIQIETLRRIREENYQPGIGEVRALLEVGAVDRVLVAILSTLAAMGSPKEDLPRFLKFLGHPAGTVRAAAVQAFARFADPGSIIHILGPALSDRHPHARMCAIRALARVGKEGVLAELDRLVGAASPEERSKSLALLRSLRGEAVLEMVCRLAADSSDSIRLDVVHILRSHGGKHVFNTLEWLAQDTNPRIKTFAARSVMLLQRGRGQCPGLDVGQLDTVPAEVEPPPVPNLVGLAPRELVQVLMRVKRQGPPEAYDQVVPLLEREDLKPEVIASLLSVLSVLGGREDIPRVRPFLAHMDGRVRANAVEAVDVMGGRKEILTWLTPLLADTVPRVRRNVLVALGRFGEGVFLNHLQRMIHSNHVPVRISGAYALAHYPGAAAQELGKQVIQDRNAEVRLNFAEALAGKSENWTKQILEFLTRNDIDHRVRAAAQMSLEVPSGGAAPKGVVGTSPGAAVADPVSSVTQPGAPVAAAPASLPPLAMPEGLVPPASPSVPAQACPPPTTPGESYTMVDGLPMCPLPDSPSPSVRVAPEIQAQDGLQGGGAGPGPVAVDFSPSVDIPKDLIMGAATQAAEALSAQKQELPLEESEEEESQALVLETMSAKPQDGKEVGESSADLLGQTFMNFAAFISPGKMAGMKEIQALEKDRNKLLERLGRGLYGEIKAGALKHAVFERTLFVLKKYLHNKKQMSGKAPEEAKPGGWFGGLFGGGKNEGEEGSEDLPQLRAQYRNIAKDALKVREGGEIDLSGHQSQLDEIDALDAKIQALRDKK